MPSIEERKVITTGPSYAVTIPKPFVDYSAMKPGDEVTLIYNNIILVLPKGVKIDEQKRKLIEKLMR